jgi:hypothetical protein
MAANNGLIVLPTGIDMSDAGAVEAALSYIPQSDLPGPFCDIGFDKTIYPIGAGFDLSSLDIGGILEHLTDPTDLLHAWSMRDISRDSGETGVTLRRTSDSDEEDFGFDNRGFLSPDAVLTWAGASAVTISRMYALGEGSANAVQTTTAAQPHVDLSEARLPISAAAGTYVAATLPSGLTNAYQLRVDHEKNVHLSLIPSIASGAYELNANEQHILKSDTPASDLVAAARNASQFWQSPLYLNALHTPTLLTIYTPDALRNQVEAQSQGRNTVLYTAKGQPCMMYVLPKFNVEEIDASLGTGTHPAFVVGGVEKSEILIGQFCGASVNGELISQPGRAVAHTINHDGAVALARANGAGWHVMTNAEWAAISLRCWKGGWMPRGNTDYGRSSDDTSEYGIQENGRAITIGGSGSGGERTLTGSGPSAWRHDRTPSGIADLCGNVWEWAPGLRIVDGEINVIADNDMALSATDDAVGSVAWRAIDGATGALVAPGSSGVVRYAGSGTADYSLVAATGAPVETMSNPGATPVGADALALCKRLGLFPIAPSGLNSDRFYWTESGERLPRRGGYWASAADAGVFAFNLTSARVNASPFIGARPAFVA